MTSTLRGMDDSFDEDEEIDVSGFSSQDMLINPLISTPVMLYEASTFDKQDNNSNMKNAGRKKSNPAWEYFDDMRLHGLPGARCKHCAFYSNNRSPTILKFHIKRSHDTGIDGLWHRLNKIYNWQSPHKYSSNKLKSKAAKNCVQLGISNKLNTTVKSVKRSVTSSTFKNELLNPLFENDMLTNDENLVQQKCKTKTVYNNCNINNSIMASSKPKIKGRKVSVVERETGKFLEFTCLDSYKSNLPKAAMCDRAIDMSQRTRPKNANNWTYLATFDNEDEMHKIRIKEKVSKRRTEQLKNGVKIRYRCNKWKRTKCGYQMFALFAKNKIDLYETGVHDHSGDRYKLHLDKMHNKGIFPTFAKKPSTSTSQVKIYQNFLKPTTNEAKIGMNTTCNKDTVITGVLPTADSRVKSEPISELEVDCDIVNSPKKTNHCLVNVLRPDTILNFKQLISDDCYVNKTTNVKTETESVENVHCNNSLQTNSQLTVLLTSWNKVNNTPLNSYVSGLKSRPLSFTEKINIEVDDRNDDSMCCVVNSTFNQNHNNVNVVPPCDRVFIGFQSEKRQESEVSAKSYKRSSFKLNDTTKISQLLEIATNLELTLSLCNNEIIEYIFYSKLKPGNRSIAISDYNAEKVVCVKNLYDGKVVVEECWAKADWSQFLWAIRGKCSQFLC